MNNKQTGFVGDNNSIGSIQNTNKQNKENNINKFKTIIKHEVILENRTPLAFFNPYNKDAIPFKRLSHVNDRPMLKKYFDALNQERTEKQPMNFYAFVSAKKGIDKYILSNVVDEFGNLVATHALMCLISIYLTIYMN